MHSIKMNLGNRQCRIYVGPEFPHRITNWDVKRHCNAQFEFHVALSGSCTVDVDTRSFSLSFGDALLIAPGQYHCPKKMTADYECFIFSFAIKTDSFAKRFYESNSKSVKMQLSEFELALCKEILDKNRENELLRYQCVGSVYFLLLSGIFKKLGCFENTKETNSANSDRRLDHIDDFFEQNLAENATEEALAKRLNLSTRQLNRVLQTNYGTNFRKKLCNARMNSSGWLLRTTNMSVSEIGKTVGYLSDTSFFKAFKAYYGITPLQYRKKNEEDSE
ncbi:MAG: helix-turn-helix transcriptional regulator [Clostridia bacterium]|nr:helix-turn-helix transcriptional regulator [Clostridia bacterium]